MIQGKCFMLYKRSAHSLFRVQYVCALLKTWLYISDNCNNSLGAVGVGLDTCESYSRTCCVEVVR